MKNVYLLIIFCFVSALLHAQYTYTNFDDTQNVTFSGWPNAPTVSANPNPSRINTSAQVGKWIRTNQQWAHCYTNLDGYVNFTNSHIFYLKVYSPKICQVLLKLEDKNNSAIFAQVFGNVSTINQWTQLQFDFGTAQTGIYNKIVIFFDFATTINNTFYFDDLTGPSFGAGAPPKPLAALDVQDNFENNGYSTITTWKFQDGDVPGSLPITLDPVNNQNHVVNYVRSGNFEFTNAQFELDHRMDLSQRNKFRLKVYMPSSNNYTGSLILYTPFFRPKKLFLRCI